MILSVRRMTQGRQDRVVIGNTGVCACALKPVCVRDRDLDWNPSSSLFWLCDLGKVAHLL